jgi:hypothetical protein
MPSDHTFVVFYTDKGTYKTVNPPLSRAAGPVALFGLNNEAVMTVHDMHGVVYSGFYPSSP